MQCGLFRVTRALRAVERSPFEILGLTSTATQQEIKAKYRELSKQYHPDMPTGSEEKFREVHAAFLVLKSEAGLNAARWADTNKSSNGGATSQRYGRAKGQSGHRGLSEEDINRMKAETAARDRTEGASGWGAFTSNPTEAFCGLVASIVAIAYFFMAYNKATEDYHARRQPIALDGVIGKEYKWTGKGHGRVVSLQTDDAGNTVEVEESEEAYVGRLSDSEYAKFCEQKKIHVSGMGMYTSVKDYKNQKPISPSDYRDQVPKEEKDKDEEWQRNVLEMRKSVQNRYEDFREYFYVNDADNCLNRRVVAQRIPTEMLLVSDIPNKCPMVLEYQTGDIFVKKTKLETTTSTSANQQGVSPTTPSTTRRAHENKLFNAVTGALEQVHFTTADKDSIALHGIVGTLRIPKFSPAQHAYTFIEYRDTDSRNRTPECLVAIRNMAIANDAAPSGVSSQRFIISGSKECQYELQMERDEQVSKGWSRSSEFLVGGVLPVRDASSDFDSTEKRAEERRRSMFGSGE